MTRLGIVVALPAEARCLVNRRIKPGERANVDGHGWLQLGGIGARRARRTAESLVDAGATALLSWGIAGALDPVLLPGNLVLPEAVIASDGTRYPVSVDWHARVCRCVQEHMDSNSGPLMESYSVVADATGKAALFQRSGAVAVDMESAAVAVVARHAGVPFLAIRAIADPADRRIPSAVINVVDAYGRLRLLMLLQSMLQGPRLLAELLQLRRDDRAACATLSRVVELTGPGLLA